MLERKYYRHTNYFESKDEVEIPPASTQTLNTMHKKRQRLGFARRKKGQSPCRKRRL